jgi:dihydroxyacetone kinase-like predicted kinase
MGGSVLVAGDAMTLKIHIHNDRPDLVIAYGLSVGTLSRISIENLDRQASDVRARVEAAEKAEADAEWVPTATPEATAVVAVAAGKGLAKVFETLGANAVVTGGQGANPSAGELAEAIRATGARSVIVLPNNSNVRLAAKQSGELVGGVKVEVVPTRNAGEGVAAMLAFDGELPAKDAAKAMARAARSIQTLEATTAVRDARFGRRKVRRGQYIVLGADEELVAVDNNRSAAICEALRKLRPGFELVTIYRGDGIDEAAGQLLREDLREQLPDVEVEVVDGGQPHYDFLITAE